ncbi:unnamed protein product [Rotaria socialis]|uniref:Uncharacterized protein n=3 Tax=Rotaria socialis TaxID=392032 RepID=A0A818T828_9BILA|nr:unnamed protein product [Rotaria socialis]CAF4329414.1 unnamed protein product [Rotaria socialis]
MKQTQATTNATAVASSTSFRARPRRVVQNFVLVWLDAHIDEKKEDFRNSFTELRKLVVTLETFTEVNSCVEYLKSISDQKIFLIVSGSFGQTMVPFIHNMTQLDTIFVFCSNKDRHKVWAKEWSKVEGVHGSIKSMCKQLAKTTRACDHDAIPMSFLPKRKIADAASNDQDLHHLPPAYMYSVIFKSIVLEINDDNDDAKSIKALQIYCKKQNIPDAEINELKRKYHQESPIWWYTCEMFLYGMLNRGLRSVNMETMSKLGFFIRSLHLQLGQLHQEQSANFKKPFTVYRGQGLSKEDFQKLLDSKGGLLSFNNFLSTSMEQKVGMAFVERVMQKNQDIVGVIFIMKIDPSKISTSITPFAMIDDYAAVKREQEILFTLHTIFRVVEIKQTAKNSRLWEVQLTITDDNDPQLSTVTKRINEEIDGRGWYRMGQLMLKVRHFDEAERLYNELLENASTDSDRAYIYHQLGWLKDDQGKYLEAVKFYEKYLEIKRETLPQDDASLAPTYNNIGTVYNNMDDYSKALEFYEKANKIYEKALPPNHPNLATSYCSIGTVYNNMGDYSKALEFYKKDIAIKKISLSPTHPALANSYNNIGVAYSGMGDHSKAISLLEKALDIYRNSLPSTHPNIKRVMNSIEAVKKKL